MSEHDELAKLLLDARNRALERLYPGGSDENDTWDKITTHQRSMLREQATALLDSFLDNDTVYDAVENAVMVEMLKLGYDDGGWPAITTAALAALKKVL